MTMRSLLGEAYAAEMERLFMAPSQPIAERYIPKMIDRESITNKSIVADLDEAIRCKAAVEAFGSVNDAARHLGIDDVLGPIRRHARDLEGDATIRAEVQRLALEYKGKQ